MNFEIDYKKILLLIGFVLVCVFLGFLIYWLFFKPALPKIEALPETGAPSGEETGLPTSGERDGAGAAIDADTGLPIRPEIAPEGETPAALPDKTASGGVTKTTLLSGAAGFAPTISSNGSDLYYYNRDNGRFYRITRDGQISLLSDKTFYNVEKITWSPNKQKVILEYPDGANILYNFQTKKQLTIPKHWKDFDFSPQSEQIVAKSMGIDPANRWLIVSNDDGSKAEAIEHLGEKDDSVYPSWSPNNLSVAMFTESVDFNRQKLYFVGQNKENFKATVVEGRGIDFQWTPSGEKLIYSVYSDTNDLKPSLWMVNAKGEGIGSNRQRLNIETWANKCAVASESALYCAVPLALPEGAGLFKELAANVPDNIYKVNINTGARELIAIPDKEYTINNLVVSQFEDYLFFTDANTGNIHKIDLK